MHPALKLGRGLAQQVLAGYAQMHVARQQRLGDFGRRKQHHIDVAKAVQRGAVAARAGALFQFGARIGEIGVAIFLQAAFGRNGQSQDRRRGRGHDAASSRALFPWAWRAARRRSVRIATPIAETGLPAPSVSSSES